MFLNQIFKNVQKKHKETKSDDDDHIRIKVSDTQELYKN